MERANCLLNICLFLSGFHVILGQGGDIWVIVADWEPAQIHILSLAKSKIHTLPITVIGRPVAIDFHPTENEIYWTDVGLKRIQATTLIGGSTRTLRDLTSNAVPDGLALDTVARKVFYTDAGNDVIAVMDMDGNNHQVLLAKENGLNEPRAIVLDVVERKFYFTDWGSTPHISVANYDGSGMRNIFRTRLGWPNGLVLDKADGYLYWCDAQTSMIESGSVDGSKRTLIYNQPGAHFFDIFLLADRLYFTDWKTNSILTLPKHGGKVSGMSSSRLGKLAGIHVFSNTTLPDCPENKFGSTCSDCGQCMSSLDCEKITGFCLGGCKPGYTGGHCKENCPRGSHGHNCELTCDTCHAEDCHHETGYCLSGCVPGRKGFNCSEACDPFTFGTECTPCGFCAGGRSCDRVSGMCPTGCKDGWSGTRCDKAESVEKSNLAESVEKSNLAESVEKSNLGAIIGGAVGAFAILVIAIIVLAIVFRKRCLKTERNQQMVVYDIPHTHQCHAYAIPTTNDPPPSYATIGDCSGMDTLRLSRDLNQSSEYETLGPVQDRGDGYMKPLEFNTQPQKFGMKIEPSLTEQC